MLDPGLQTREELAWLDVLVAAAAVVDIVVAMGTKGMSWEMLDDV